MTSSASPAYHLLLVCAEVHNGSLNMANPVGSPTKYFKVKCFDLHLTSVPDHLADHCNAPPDTLQDSLEATPAHSKVLTSKQHTWQEQKYYPCNLVYMLRRAHDTACPSQTWLPKQQAKTLSKILPSS